MARLLTSTSPYDYLPVKYPPLTPQGLDAFLKERLVAQLATVSKDGSPHVKPVWFRWDGEKVWMITWLKCKTVYNIQHHSRVAVSIDSSRAPVTSFPDMGCLIHGEAELVPEVKNKVDPKSWHFKIFAKYLGEENCYRPPQSIHLANPNMAIGVKPTKILSWDYTKAPKE
jgi:general stress protein 26